MKLKKLSCALLAVTMIFSSCALVTANAQTTNSLSSYKKGDLDFDGVRSPEDITKLHKYIIGDYTPGYSETEMLAIADINKDGIVNRADIDKYIDAFIYADKNLGDINGDGELSVSDATEIQKYLVQIIPYLDFDKILCADVNSDNDISVIDATEIQKHIVDLPNALDAPSNFPTPQIIDDDETYRIVYREDIDAIENSGKFSFDGVYVVKPPEIRDELLVRDEEWCYSISPVSGVTLWGRYNTGNPTAILPTSLNGYPISYVSEFFCEEELFPGPEITGVNSIETLIIPTSNNKTYFNGDCFKNLLSLKNVFFQEGVKSEKLIAGGLFAGCPKLESVIWPSTATYIPQDMFCVCKKITSLKQISIPETVTTIRPNAFLASGLTEVVVPANITNIGREAFGSIPANTVTFLSKSPSLTIDPGALLPSFDEMSTNTKKITVYGYKSSGYSSFVNGILSDSVWEYAPIPYTFKYLQE